MSRTNVFLVGAGPGDKELITLKGLKILSQADVILYDHLISNELLACAKEDAEKIFVGKRASHHTLPQEQINALIVQKAKAGKMVVRLKGGDCCLFGRGGEEAQACRDAGLAFEVVPGITSALAAPCYAGIPPTHRDFTSDVAIVTGHRKKGDDRPIDIPRAGTVIFLMSVANIANIIQSLLEAGYPGDTKIAAIERGTCYNQRVLKGTLDNFLNTLKDTPLRTPAVFIIGKVVELQEQLDWFSKKPRILHLGIHPEHYSHLGTIVHRPIIECVESDTTGPMTETIRHAGQYDWIIFTSGNGIRFFFKKLYAAGLDARIFSNTKFAVIGQASAEQLMEFGIKADLCAAVESSAGLLDAFANIDIAGLSILLPQAEVSSPDLPEGLSKNGAKVEKLVVYQTIEKEIDDVDLDYIDQILFTSGSTVRAFVKKFASVPEHIQAMCLGVPTQTTAKQYNINAKIIEKDPDAES
ncbi:MAG: uroporphyrinogen-III C-methyltransferase [Phycisphaerae bacterium]|nr:uroporphyrinogen-III C-methyltransferase [Phycisphaerae bacterium]